MEMTSLGLFAAGATAPAGVAGLVSWEVSGLRQLGNGGKRHAIPSEQGRRSPGTLRPERLAHPG